MQLEVGAILEGKVTRITNFGAFVALENGKNGLIHISEISTSYVEKVSDHLKEGDTVKVKVVSISDDGKIELSKKRVDMESMGNSENHNNAGKFNRKPYNNSENNSQRSNNFSGSNGFSRDFKKDYKQNNYNRSNSGFRDNRNNDFNNKNNANKFEDMLNKFKKLSEEKLAGFEKTKSRRGRSSHREGNME